MAKIFDGKAGFDQRRKICGVFLNRIAKHNGIKSCRKVLERHGLALSLGKPSVTAAGADDDRLSFFDLKLGVWLVDVGLNV